MEDEYLVCDEELSCVSFPANRKDLVKRFVEELQESGERIIILARVERIIDNDFE